VVVAIGRMGKPNKPNYKIPPSIRQKVNFNLDNWTQGEKIVVVGGGDSALEYAIDLCDDNTGTLNYRRTEFARANPTNGQNITDAQWRREIEIEKLRGGIFSIQPWRKWKPLGFLFKGGKFWKGLGLSGSYWKEPFYPNKGAPKPRGEFQKKRGD